MHLREIGNPYGTILDECVESPLWHFLKDIWRPFGLYWKLEFTRLIDYWTFFLCEYIVFVFTTASKCYSVLVTCVLSWRVSEAMLVHCEMRCRGTVTPINSSTKQQGSRWLRSHGTFSMVAWSNTKCTYCPGIHVCLSTVSLWMK